MPEQVYCICEVRGCHNLLLNMESMWGSDEYFYLLYYFTHQDLLTYLCRCAIDIHTLRTALTANT